MQKLTDMVMKLEMAYDILAGGFRGPASRIREDFIPVFFSTPGPARWRR
jgi:hypothetical protein